MKLKAILLATALAAAFGSASGARASAITRTFDLATYNLYDLPSPNPLTVDITVTFDPTQDQAPTMNGIYISNNNVPLSGGIEFGYDYAYDTLNVGYDVYPVLREIGYTGPNEFITYIQNASTTSPVVGVSGFQYNDDDGQNHSQGITTVTLGTVSAAPEPSTWALMIAGIGVTGAMMRARARRPFASVAGA